ncbi:hypothetical protein C4568_01285 [Candidatus Parcubacteria bacterium]|nr:MAG: hypothetical protein C4568_01285 [Candidatus Parcubacteria bacterium]
MIKENDSPVNYLDKEILKDLCHDIASRLFQEEEPMGLYEDHDQAKLDSCLNLPRQAVFGQELYSGIYKKAAITFYAFNRNHAFGNGNKRLSVAATIVFLYINNVAVVAGRGELRDKALWLAQTELPIEKAVDDLAIWLEERTIPLEQFREILNGQSIDSKD